MKSKTLSSFDLLCIETEDIFRGLDRLSEEELLDTTYGWSLIQVLVHLMEAERVSLHYMRKKSRAGDKMSQANAWTEAKMKLVNIFLQTPLKWKAPSYIAQPAVLSFSRIKKEWAETREALRQFINQYPETWANRLVYKHPMAGRQTLKNAIDSFRYHQQHHVFQINRIKKQIGIDA